MTLIQNIAVVGAQKVGAVEAFSTFIVGMGVVFIALIILVFILESSGKFFESRDKKVAAQQAAIKTAVSETVEPAIVEEVEINEMDDLELVAVITASIAATMGTSPEGLQVRSLRKTNNVWGMSGRNEQIYN